MNQTKGDCYGTLRSHILNIESSLVQITQMRNHRVAESYPGLSTVIDPCQKMLATVRGASKDLDLLFSSVFNHCDVPTHENFSSSIEATDQREDASATLLGEVCSSGPGAKRESNNEAGDTPKVKRVKTCVADGTVNIVFDVNHEDIAAEVEARLLQKAAGRQGPPGRKRKRESSTCSSTMSDYAVDSSTKHRLSPASFQESSDVHINHDEHISRRQKRRRRGGGSSISQGVSII